MIKWCIWAKKTWNIYRLSLSEIDYGCTQWFVSGLVILTGWLGTECDRSV